MATQNYSHLVNCMMASSLHSNPDIPFTCYTFGWNKKLLNDFREFYKGYEFIEKNVPQEYYDFLESDDVDYLKGKLLPLFRHRNGYMLEIFKKYNEPILSVDVDGLILKDMTPFLNEYQHCDIVLGRGMGFDNPDDQKRKQRFFTLDFVLCNPTANCLEFLEYASKVSLEISSDEALKLFYDQLGFYYAYEKFKNKVKIEIIDRKYYDERNIDFKSDHTFFHYNYKSEQKYETFPKVFFYFREKGIKYLKTKEFSLDIVEGRNHVCTRKGNIY